MKAILVFVFTMMLGVAVNAQSNKEVKTTSSKTTTTTNPTHLTQAQIDAKATTPHVCTAACKNGKHVYLHGEKGHVCGTECTKTKKSTKKTTVSSTKTTK